MHLALNLAWFAIAIAAFLFVPRRDLRVLVAIAVALAILFPIISPSDDVSSAPALSDGAAVLSVVVALTIAFVTIERLRSARLAAYAVHFAAPSDPRSPPSR